MGDLSFEGTLITACIQNEEIFKRARRAGFDSDFFSDNVLYEYLFQQATYLHQIGNPFTKSAFEKIIANDGTLTDREKAAYVAKVHTLLNTRVESDAELAFDRLKQRKQDRDILELIRSGAQDYKAHKDPAEIIDSLRRGINRLTTLSHEFEIQNFWAEFHKRREKREAVVELSSDRFHFREPLIPFQRYFPRGIPAETLFSVAGPTFAGKSTVLVNMARLAVSPANGLDTIYIAAENSMEQTGNRLDALILDREYDELFDQEYHEGPLSDIDFTFFRTAKKRGWGDLYIVKVPTKRFDANTIRQIIESVVDQGGAPKVLFVDSPDHQLPVAKSDQWWMDKGNVYYDLKDVAEEYQQIVFMSTPMKPSSVKKEAVSNEDVGGSYDISRVLDFQIMFNVDPQDRLLRRGRLVVTKNREYGLIDNKPVDLYFKHSNLLVPFDEALVEMPEVRVHKDEEE